MNFMIWKKIHIMNTFNCLSCNTSKRSMIKREFALVDAHISTFQPAVYSVRTGGLVASYFFKKKNNFKLISNIFF